MSGVRSIRLGVVVAMVCVWLLADVAGAGASASKIGWGKCYGQFQCGTLQVPLDYSRPSGPRISLAVVRLRATDTARRIGSLLLNPGGPGGSGVDFTVFAGPSLYTPEVRARFDLVGFDPRGIARSTALRCFGNPKQWDPAFTSFAFPLTAEEV
jgi:pimeloyl-ACP methyl ester carboxylesterase